MASSFSSIFPEITLFSKATIMNSINSSCEILRKLYIILFTFKDYVMLANVILVFSSTKLTIEAILIALSSSLIFNSNLN